MRRAPSLAALVAALALAGCASFSGIEPQSRLSDPAAVTPAAAASTVPAVAPQWWKALGDPQLDTLVDQALAGSPTLKVAQARLNRARAVLEVANAATLPQVEGSVGVRRQRHTQAGAVPPPLAGSIRDSGTLQLGASWEIDFFGKYAQALEAALGGARASQAEVDAARVLLASQVARGYFQLARVNDQLQVAQRSLAQREEQLGLVRDRVRAGLDTTLELRQSEGALPEARQQIEALKEQAELTRNALAALVGRPDLRMEPPSLAQAHPAPVPVTVPATPNPPAHAAPRPTSPPSPVRQRPPGDARTPDET